MHSLTELAQSWLDDAETLDKYRDERGAELCRLHAAELEEALRERSREALTLAEAAKASGYSVDHLRHLVADGTIPNAGRKGAPAILRRDVPVKPGTARETPTGAGVEEDVEAILSQLGDVA